MKIEDIKVGDILFEPGSASGQFPYGEFFLVDNIIFDLCLLKGVSFSVVKKAPTSEILALEETDKGRRLVTNLRRGTTTTIINYTLITSEYQLDAIKTLIAEARENGIENLKKMERDAQQTVKKSLSKIQKSERSKRLLG